MKTTWDNRKNNLGQLFQGGTPNRATHGGSAGFGEGKSFPMIGKFFSNDWKIFFQWLENFGGGL